MNGSSNEKEKKNLSLFNEVIDCLEFMNIQISINDDDNFLSSYKTIRPAAIIHT
jgi:hypothetical protein